MALLHYLDAPPEIRGLIQEIPAVDVSDFTRDQWLQSRKNGIGGSEISAIVGVNPFETALGVYLHKLGLIPDIEMNDAMHFGNLLEPIVASEFSRRTGFTVLEMKFLLHHPLYEFLIANIDRLIVHPERGFGVLECKTTSAYKLSEWEYGKVPAHYYMQIQHYLSITGFSFAYAACLVGGNTYRYTLIERDDEMIDYLTEQGIDFWFNHIVSQVPPAAGHGDLSALAELYPQHTEGEVLNLDDEQMPLISELLDARQQAKTVEKRINLAKVKIQEVMGIAEILCISGEKMISWKTNKKGSRVFNVLCDEEGA